MKNTVKYSTGICRMGSNGTKIHALYIIDGVPSVNTICQQNNHSTWKIPTNIKAVQATQKNVTCSNCLTHLKGDSDEG